MASDGRGSLLEAVWMGIEAIAAALAGVLAHSIALITFGADGVIELVAGGARDGVPDEPAKAW